MKSLKNFIENEIFLFIDLDGTLIDTDRIHFEGYKYSFKKFNIEITFEEYLKITEKNKMDNYLDIYYKNIKNEIKKYKKEYLINIDHKELKFIAGAESFINWIYLNKINHVIVTNTHNDIVSSFKNKLPQLNKLKNWVTRENYNFPKPNSECYLLAKNLYYLNEPNIIGIENSIHGYLAIKNIVDKVIIVCNKENLEYNYFSKEKNIQIINNYLDIL
jgi:beta-phosphoglucomutase